MVWILGSPYEKGLFGGTTIKSQTNGPQTDNELLAEETYTKTNMVWILSVVRRQCFGGFYRSFLKVFTLRRSRSAHPRFFGFGRRKKTGVHQRFLVASTALHETAGVTWQNYQLNCCGAGIIWYIVDFFQLDLLGREWG